MRHILHNGHSRGSVINVNDHIHGKIVMNLIGLLMNPVDSCHNNESCRFINESCRFINESSMNLINKVHVSYHLRSL